MKLRRHKAAPILLAAGVLWAVCLIAILLHPKRSTLGSDVQRELNMIDRLEAMTFDARVRLSTHFASPVSDRLAVVFLDDVAIEQMNRDELGFRYMWPWPRFIYGRLTRELAVQQADAIAFDILFADEYARDTETDVFPDGRNANAKTRENAADLARALVEQDVAVEFVETETNIIGSDDFFAAQIAAASNVILAAEQDLLPLPRFRTNALAVGSVTATPDAGVLRRVKAFSTIRNWHPAILEVAEALELDLPTGRVVGQKLIFNKTRGSELHTFKLGPSGALLMENFAQDEPESPEPAFREERVWNLGLVTAAHGLGIDLRTAVVSPDSITLRSEKGELNIPLDHDGMFYVDWAVDFDSVKAGKTPIHIGSLKELLMNDYGRLQQVEVDSENKFKDRLTLIGSTATGNNVTDLGATPIAERMPLVMTHLNIANAVLNGRFITRLPFTLEILLTLLLGSVAALASWRTRVTAAIGAVAILAIAYIAIGCMLYVEKRLWIPFVLPVGGGLILPHFTMVAYRLIFEQRERRHVTSVFSKVVSPAVVDDLLNSQSLGLGGVRREITIYFADVRGFTEFTDQAQAAAEEYVQKYGLSARDAENYYDFQAAETLRTVNTYLACIADVVKKHNGTLDKYIGDCVMAFWGAPTPNPLHAVTCVQAAIEAQRALERLNTSRAADNEARRKENERRRAANQPPLPETPILQMGTGINTGPATVGLMGSDSHILNYTVFGREVNVASRLEGISQKSRIIIGERTYEHVLRDDPELAARCVPLEPVHVKGIAAPVKIYEVLWRA